MWHSTLLLDCEVEEGSIERERVRERASVFIRYGVKHERTEIKE